MSDVALPKTQTAADLAKAAGLPLAKDYISQLREKYLKPSTMTPEEVAKATKVIAGEHANRGTLTSENPLALATELITPAASMAKSAITVPGAEKLPLVSPLTGTVDPLAAINRLRSSLEQQGVKVTEPITKLEKFQAENPKMTTISDIAQLATGGWQLLKALSPKAAGFLAKHTGMPSKPAIARMVEDDLPEGTFEGEHRPPSDEEIDALLRDIQGGHESTHADYVTPEWTPSESIDAYPDVNLHSLRDDPGTRAFGHDFDEVKSIIKMDPADTIATMRKKLGNTKDYTVSIPGQHVSITPRVGVGRDPETGARLFKLPEVYQQKLDKLNQDYRALGMPEETSLEPILYTQNNAKLSRGDNIDARFPSRYTPGAFDIKLPDVRTSDIQYGEAAWKPETELERRFKNTMARVHNHATMQQAKFLPIANAEEPWVPGNTWHTHYLNYPLVDAVQNAIIEGKTPEEIIKVFKSKGLAIQAKKMAEAAERKIGAPAGSSVNVYDISPSTDIEDYASRQQLRELLNSGMPYEKALDRIQQDFPRSIIEDLKGNRSLIAGSVDATWQGADPKGFTGITTQAVPESFSMLRDRIARIRSQLTKYKGTNQ